MTGYEFAKAHYEASRQRMIYAATSKSRIRPRILSALSDGPMTMRQLSIVLTVRFDSINQQIVLLLRDGLIRRMGTTLPDAVDGKTRQLFGLLADA